MRFTSFKYESELITSEKKITQILKENDMNWILESEFDNADIEIQNKTLIWNSGIWYWGNWHFGIWKSGDWVDGTFENGIWESGNFIGGKLLSGIWLDGNITGGEVMIKNN